MSEKTHVNHWGQQTWQKCKRRRETLVSVYNRVKQTVDWDRFNKDERRSQQYRLKW